VANLVAYEQPKRI